jgi:hypothetical protein
MSALWFFPIVKSIAKLLVVCAVAAAVLPATTNAADVQQGAGGTDGVAVVGLSSDPRNDLTLTQNGAELIIEDSAAPLTSPSTCRQETPNRVVCPMPTATHLNISTSDADDTVTMHLAAGAPQTDIYTHGGNDTVDTRDGPVDRVDCGDGLDTWQGDTDDRSSA